MQQVEAPGTCKFTSENRAATSKKQNIGKIGKQPSKDEDRKSNNLVKQSSKDSAKDFAKSPKLSEPEIPHKKESTDASINETVTGMFSLFQSFTLHGQISSVSVCKTASGQNQLMASQPGGGYVVLATYGKNGTETEQKERKDKNQIDQYGISYPLTSHRSRSLLVNTELLGSLRRQGSLSGLSCLCTLDGLFTLIDHENSSFPPVSRTSEHKWFTMDRLDVTADGNDEVVLCSWEGMTYVIDKDNDVMSYSFGENVCAFSAGMYAVSKTNVPCFCYVSFSNRVMLYYNVKVDNMKSRCVQDAVLERLNNRPEFNSILQKLKNSNGEINSAQIQNLTKEALSKR